MAKKYLMGYDIGSSSVKASLLDIDTGTLVASASSPKVEMPMDSPKAGWAEQHPSLWWEHIKNVTQELKSKLKLQGDEIQGIGIAYQMHGLVIVDEAQNVLRPSIIWCDSRAVNIGNDAFEGLGKEVCMARFLNSPGNFTASKLKWVQENEPHIYEKIHKAMLPGDYIAMKLTGDINSTISGISEGIFWDFKDGKIAQSLLDYYKIDASILPELVPTFSNQGVMNTSAAKELGLKAGIPIAYRAGDQPNNAFSLNVLNPGELAATAGTSGVVYGINQAATYDAQERVNTFVHVNHTKENPSHGVLLCVNGTGILNSWLKHNVGGNIDYPKMNDLASSAPVGSDGLVVLPFGNGAERILQNQELGGQIHGLNFNRHHQGHLFRAAQEGIVFALNYGLEAMKEMGIRMEKVRAGNANMFLSPIFRETFANLTGTTVQLYDTDGAQGAARGAGIGLNIYHNYEQAFQGLKAIETIEPDMSMKSIYARKYQEWLSILEKEKSS